MNKQKSFVLIGFALLCFALALWPVVVMAEPCPTHEVELVCHVEEDRALDRAAAQYRTCATCHGQMGEGGIGPALIGRPPEYLYMRLTQYKQRETVGAMSSLMWSQVTTYHEDDLRMLAEYVSRLRPTLVD